DGDRLAAAPHLLDVGLGPQGDDAPPGGVGLADAAAPVDVAAGREVGPRDQLDQLVDGDVRVFEDPVWPVPPPAEVVGRDVCGNTARDAGGAVDEEVRHPGGQDHRLLERLVEVRGEVDGLLLDVGQQLVGDLGQSRL